jgi:hypothetical protein
MSAGTPRKWIARGESGESGESGLERHWGTEYIDTVGDEW